MAKNSNIINIEIEVDEEIINSIFEGIEFQNIINYWADDIIVFKKKDDSYSYAMIKSYENSDWKYLTRKGILSGIGSVIKEERLATNELDPFNFDNPCIDITVQYALFGEVVYS